MATDLTQFLDRPEDIEASVRKNASQLGLSLTEEGVQSKVQEVQGLISSRQPQPDEMSAESTEDVLDTSLYKDTVNPIEIKKEGMPTEVAKEESFLFELSKDFPDFVNMLQNQKELEGQGLSEEIENARSDEAKKVNKALIDQEIMQVANGEKTPEEANQFLMDTPAYTEEEVNWFRKFYTNSMFRRHARDELEEIVGHNKVRELIEDDWGANIALAERVDFYTSFLGKGTGRNDISLDTLKLAGGVGSDLFPYSTQIGMISAVSDVLGLELSFLQKLGRGNITGIVRDRLAAMSPKERYDTSVLVMENLMENENFLTASDYQKLQQMYSFFDPEWGFLDKSIENAISVVDAIAIGGLARAFFQMTRIGLKPGSNIDYLNMANQAEASRLIATDLRNTTLAADELGHTGMSREELAEVIFAGESWESPQLLPAQVAKNIEESERIGVEVYEGTYNNAIALKENEMPTEDALRKALDNVDEHGLYDSNIAMRQTDSGMEFTAKFGQKNADGEVIPFNRPVDAMEAAQRQFPKGNITIFKVTKTKGLQPLGKLKPTSTALGEYIFQVSGKKSYVDTSVQGDKLFFVDGDVVVSGNVTEYFLSPSERLAREISGAYDQSGDWSKGIATKLAKIIQPLAKMSKDRQMKVVKLLKDYEKDPTWDAYRLAVEAGDDPKVIEGFVAYRKLDQALYALTDRSFIKNLKDQNAKHIIVGDFQNVGTPVNIEKLVALQQEGKLSQVFNPATGKPVDIDGRQLVNLEEQGYKIYEVLEKIGTVNKNHKYVMVKPENLANIPEIGFLRKQEGHIARFYKDPYFIRYKVDAVVDGAKQTDRVVISTAPNKVAANRRAQELKKDSRYKDFEFEVVHQRELKPKEMARVQQEDRINAGLMFWQPKGKHLTSEEGLASVDDPLAALTKNLDTMSNYVAHEDLNRVMKKKFMDTYGTGKGGLGIINSRGGFPNSVDEIGAGHSVADASVEQAKTLYRKIRASEGLMTKDQQLWKRIFVSIADGISGNSVGKGPLGAAREQAANLSLYLSDNSVNKFIRSTAFYHMIAANPFRQQFIQSKQWMFLMALDPSLAPRVMKQKHAVWNGLLKDSAPVVYNAAKDLSAKSMGMSTKEYETFIEKFKEFGVPFSVDSHDFVRASMEEISKGMNDNMMKGIARKSANAVKTPFKLAKKVGFNYGELSNLISTFLFARMRYLKKTGKKQLTSQRDWQQVSADTRGMSLSMTHSGAFAYQDGLLSAVTQFLSIQHKAALAMNFFTKKGGNQMFTQGERARLALGQVLMLGPAGLGLDALYREWRDSSGVEIPEEWEPYIVGGIFEGAINSFLSSITGEEQDLNVSDSVSMLAGSRGTATDYFAVLLGNKDWMQLMAGTKTISRYNDLANMAELMMDHPPLREDLDILDYLSMFGTVTSGWNNVLKAKAAARLGYHVNQYGSPTARATYAEALAEGIWGITSNDVQRHYSLKEDTTVPRGMENTPLFNSDTIQEHQEIAKGMYESLSKFITFHNKEYDDAVEAYQIPEVFKLHQQKLREGFRMRTSILRMYEDPMKAASIWLQFSEKLQREKEAGNTELVDGILKALSNSRIHDTDQVEQIKNRLINDKHLDPNIPRDQSKIDALDSILRSLFLQKDIMKNFEEK